MRSELIIIDHLNLRILKTEMHTVKPGPAFLIYLLKPPDRGFQLQQVFKSL